MITFKNYYLIQEESGILNAIQNALDVAGIDPGFGTLADGANTLISLLRAAAAKEKDMQKKHLINAGISAISMIPFADVVKILKLRNVRPVAKLAVKGARTLKNSAQAAKKRGRFNDLQERKPVTA